MRYLTVTSDRLIGNIDINPRQTDTPVDDLVAQIRQNGFTDPLWVRPVADGRFEIIDGSRRRRALQKLWENGEIADDFQIPVTVIEAGDAQARELALAANVARADLNPADEAVGFYRLKLSGMDEAAIAAHFAVPERRVRQRLALGALPEPILEALRAGDIGLAAAQAFTLTASAERQIEVFRHLDRAGGKAVTESYVRDALIDSAVAANSREARFVGLEIYEAAGGAVSRDLFSEDVWLADGALLKRLFEEKVAATADALRRDGWSFVEVRDRDVWKIDGWEALTPKGKRVMTEGEAEELTRLRADLARLEAELGALDERGDDSFDVAEFDAIDDRCQDIANAIAALESPPFTAAQKRKSGVVIAFDFDAIRIRKGLVRPDKGKAAGHGEKTDSGGAENEAAPAMAAWSEAAETMLVKTAQRGCEAAMVAKRPALAARLGLAVRIVAAMGGYTAGPFRLRPQTVKAEFAEALTAFGETQSVFDIADRLETLPPDEIVAIEAALAAAALDIVSLGDVETRRLIERLDPVMDGVAGFAAGEFLALLGRDQIAAVIAECDPAGKPPARGTKKPDLVKIATSLAEATGWLPEPLRAPSYAGPGSNAFAEASAKIREAP